MSTFSIIALMLSIFNIVDLLVTNANNNNNRNNINDNANNNNDNSNTESNGNPDQASANQAMFTPPGAGRRKREARMTSEPMILKPEMIKNQLRLRIFPKDNANSSQGLFSAWYEVNNMTRVQDELVLGMSMVTNAWHLMEAASKDCHVRNLCELGFNGSVWGEMAELVVELMGKVMARWISEDDVMEMELVKSLKLGITGGRKFKEGEDYDSCDSQFVDVCPISNWNKFVMETKILAHKSDNFGLY